MFYTYVWLRDDGTPYYVGKGSGNRAYIRHGHRCAPPASVDHIVFYIAKDEVDAFEMEELLIWYYGRWDLGLGRLRNLTNGGDSPPSRKGSPPNSGSFKPGTNRWTGRVHSEKSKVRMSKAKKGKPWSDIKRKAFKGYVPTEETNRKISAALKGIKRSEETRMRVSIAAKSREKRKAQEKLCQAPV